MHLPRGSPVIKVLTDLENGPTRVAIDMQDLKDLKSRFFQKGFRRCEGDNPANPKILQILIQTVRGIAGDRPPRYGNRTVFHNSVVRARLIPNGSGSGDPALQGGCGLTLPRHRTFAGNRDREVSPTGRSRGTGPRATGTGHFLDRTAPFEDAPNNETETRLDTYYITRYHIFTKAGSLFRPSPTCR